MAGGDYSYDQTQSYDKTGGDYDQSYDKTGGDYEQIQRRFIMIKLELEGWL